MLLGSSFIFRADLSTPSLILHLLFSSSLHSDLWVLLSGSSPCPYPHLISSPLISCPPFTPSSVLSDKERRNQRGDRGIQRRNQRGEEGTGNSRRRGMCVFQVRAAIQTNQLQNDLCCRLLFTHSLRGRGRSTPYWPSNTFSIAIVLVLGQGNLEVRVV